MLKNNLKTHKGAIIIKLICMLSAAIVMVSAFTGHRPLMGTGFIGMGLMFLHEAIVLLLQGRSASWKEQLPFTMILLFCVGFDFII
ncbi:MAG: hypothetical protein FJ041_02970 [Candidatus Cloacimonetes bacterium]|nr:hypothetical protein [Candidatus Cloacimonadota bacterium]